MSGENLSEPVSTCISPNTKKEMYMVCKELNRTISWVTREAIEHYLATEMRPVLSAMLKQELESMEKEVK